MKETLQIDRYTCDICKQVLEVAKGTTPPPMISITLPSNYYNEYGTQRSISTAKFEVCENCARKMIDNLDTFYKIADYMYGSPTIEERCRQVKNDEN